MSDDNHQAAERLLRFWLRQCDGGTPPAVVPMVPALAKLVDQPTAQKIWDDLLRQFDPNPVMP
jgi:hypothetical protein